MTFNLRRLLQTIISLCWNDLQVDDKNGESIYVPEVRMTFKSEKDAYDFYNCYAGKIGFSVRKSHSKLRRDGTIYQKHIVCSNEGDRDTHSKHVYHERECYYKVLLRCPCSVQYLSRGRLDGAKGYT